MRIKSTLILCACILLFVTVIPDKTIAQQTQGFVSVTELTPLPIVRSTGEKPQSKVWTYACKQWAVLADKSGTHLWSLEGKTWKNVLKLSDVVAKADCKIVDSVAHVLLFTGSGRSESYLISLQYSYETGTYDFWSERPASSTVSLSPTAKTATIDIDGQGRMWLASDDIPNITVRWSDAPYITWSKPINVATNAHPNDIGAVVALPGKIGVMWSNLNVQRFGFRYHNDGDDPTAWSEDEVPASQSAQDIHLGMADDHINMAVANDGTLYCAIKTEYDTRNETKLGLLVRRPNGTWDDLHNVSKSGTRPIVILNEEKQKLKVVYTSTDIDSDIVYKETSTKEIAFSEAIPLIQGTYNNVTSTKSNYNSDVVILASDSLRAIAVGVLASDGDSPNDVCKNGLWTAYPNPFALQTTVYFSLPEGGNYSLKLYDSRGAHVANIKQGFTEAQRLNKVNIDSDKFARGLYIVKLQTGSKMKSLKLVISR